MGYKLSEGAIKTIMTGGTVTDPVFQILASEDISDKGANERYRLLISDGLHSNSFAMLGSQLNHMVTGGELVENTIVKITNHIVSVIKDQRKGDKRMLVILGIEVLQHGSRVGRMGNPVQFVDNQQNNVEKPPFTPQNMIQPCAGSFAGPAFPRRSLNDTVYNSSPSLTSRTHTIASLRPSQNSWVIKARVTNKSSVIQWKNAKGKGFRFFINMVDESGEIRAAAFNKEVVKFYDLIEENKVYFISNCQIMLANKKYCTLNNEYEMIFTRNTRVKECLENDHSIPTLKFNFVKLNIIKDREPNTTIDVIGVCKSAGEVESVTSRTTNGELKKREVTIVDSSLTSVTLTLWNSQAESFNSDNHPIVAVKGGRINEFQEGKSISLGEGAVLQVNPYIPEAYWLRCWFNGISEDTKFNSVSKRSGTSSSVFDGKNCTLREAVDQKLGFGSNADYFNCYANVMHIRTERCIYKACPKPDCIKKVTDQNSGLYHCEKCNKDYANFNYRLMMSINIGDFSGNQWVSVFHDAGEELMQTKADNIGRWQEEDNALLIQVFKKIYLRPYQFKLRAKMETFNDETRVEYTVVSVRKPNFKERCRQLLREIEELSDIIMYI